jgi:hypothetical protein
MAKLVSTALSQFDTTDDKGGADKNTKTSNKNLAQGEQTDAALTATSYNSMMFIMREKNEGQDLRGKNERKKREKKTRDKIFSRKKRGTRCRHGETRESRK